MSGSDEDGESDAHNHDEDYEFGFAADTVIDGSYDEEFGTPMFRDVNTEITNDADLSSRGHATDDSMDPEYVYCDFEAGLIRAMDDFFPDTVAIGCLFHFLQACRRRMKKYRIPDLECKIAMRSGVLDLDILTVVPQEKMEREGVTWMTNAIKERCADSGISYSYTKWSVFWRYFRRTWIIKYPTQVWNVKLLHETRLAEQITRLNDLTAK
ncbi:unnamed protein product [Phytophthora fragariaefolia]|uniref:Unnamed protein product n=1 Tax=Phytophthora fragariaefolia TaxID=1490495 RepID=A0A9W6U0J2_9STRA|nr:unnamed protein product [Phytophthora fragariaefolia]